MPSATESLILFAILCVVFASLPVAMLIQFLAKKRLSPATTILPTPRTVAEYAPPAAELLPPPDSPPFSLTPPPIPDLHASEPWTRKDAIFAFVLALVVGLLMGPGVTLLLGGGGDAGEPVKQDFTITLFITQIIFQAGVIGVIVAYLASRRKYRLGPLFGLRSMSAAKTLGMAILWLIGAYVMLILVSSGLEQLLKQLTGLDLKPQGLVESAPDITDPVARVLMFFTLCIAAPLMEELIFRGVLFNVASRCIHPVYASVSTSVLFGVIHNNLLSFIPLTLLGLCFAEAYRRTRSLAVPILMHAMFNFVSFIAITNGLTKVQ